MRRIAIAILAVMAVCSVEARPKQDTNVGMDFLDSSFNRYDRLQKALFFNPEIGYAEYESAKLIAADLEEAGFTVEWGVSGIPTAFIATYGKGSPVIGILGEYDALPGLSQDTVAYKKPLVEGAPGHACGHNLLGTASAAGAVAISKWLSQGNKGTVRYYGCPAEETYGSKNYMARDGYFDDVDAVFSWHPDTWNNVPTHKMLAMVRARFSFTGSPKGGEGAWRVSSALDGVESFNYMMNMMREHVKASTKIQYVIVNGGEAPNVVPKHAVVDYILRNSDPEEVRRLYARAEAAAKGAAMGTGTAVECEITNGYDSRLINKTLANVFLKHFQTVGGPVLDEREQAFCREIGRAYGSKNPDDLSNFTKLPSKLQNVGGGSTDVANVSQKAPVASIHVATAVRNAGSHTWAHTATSGMTIGTKAAMCVAKVFYLSALELYTDPSVLKAIRDEFEAARVKDYKSLLGDRKPPLELVK